MPKLSELQLVALCRYRLYGVEGLRTATYSAATSTIQSLFFHRLMDKSGLTENGMIAADDYISKVGERAACWL